MLAHNGFMGALSEYYSYWIMQTLAMLLTAALIPRLRITSIFGAIGIVACLGFVNSTVWDAALFFSVPSSFTMQAITLLLSNGVLFWILVKVLPGIEVRGVAAALVAPVVFTILSMLIDKYGKTIDWSTLFQSVITSIEHLKGALRGTA